MFLAGPAYESGPKRKPRGLIVEIQLDTRKSRDKLARYASAAWHIHRCIPHVLVFSLSDDVAAYYAEPIDTDLPGYRFRAYGLGPRGVPVVTDPKIAKEYPGLSALSEIFHGDNLAVASTFIDAMQYVPDDQRSRYVEVTHTLTGRLSGPAAQILLGELMSSMPYFVSTPFAKEHFGKGKAEGRAEGLAEAVITVLNSRGIAIPEETRDRILACDDKTQLDTWLTRAAQANHIDEIF